MKFGFYRYVDDTGKAWLVKISDLLAEVAGMQAVPRQNPERLQPMGRNYKPRHLKFVAIADRPGMQKYRANVITNERNPAAVLNTKAIINGFQMRCVRYVGERRTGY